MEISRRRFLESSAIVAAASAAPGFATMAAASANTTTGAPLTDVIARLSLDDAKFLVGSLFLVHASSGDVKLCCVEVQAVGPQGTTANPLQAFSMRFVLQGAKPLKEGTYGFEHSVLGQFRLFIIPSGPGVAQRSYTAIINHQTS